jgi:hypothetical protein
MAIKEWSTTYSGASPVQDADPITGTQPDLDDESFPGAGDGDETRSSQPESLRDKLHTACKLLGDSANSPVGSICDILDRDHANGDALLLRLRARLADPSAVASKAFLYALDDAGTVKVYVRWSDGTIIELGAGFTSPLTTKGDLHGFDTGDARVPVGANGTVLTADSTVALGVKWASPAGGGATPHEEEFATTGAETPGATVTFGPLNATPRGGGTADTPTGYEILVFRNGVKMKYNAAPSTYNHYYYDSVNNEIDVLASGSADDYEVVYGS